MPERGHLRPVPDGVDPVTGEQVCTHHLGCEECNQRYYANDQLEKKYTGALAEIGRLKEDAEKKARAHELWPVGLCVYDWWKLACWHPNATFKAEDFVVVKPRLQERHLGLHGVLQAITGAAYDPMEITMKNGRKKKYDSFELICRSEEKARDFMERVPGGVDGEQWKAWLVNKVEEAFK
jgi:hypothetical protein